MSKQQTLEIPSLNVLKEGVMYTTFATDVCRKCAPENAKSGQRKLNAVTEETIAKAASDPHMFLHDKYTCACGYLTISIITMDEINYTLVPSFNRKG